MILSVVIILFAVLTAVTADDESVMYMQATPLRSLENGITAINFSGLIHCGLRCTGVTDLRIQSEKSLAKTMSFAEVDEFVVRNASNGVVVFKQSPKTIFAFERNQLHAPLVNTNTIEHFDVKSNALLATELIVEFRIKLKKQPTIDSTTWFGEVNVVVTTTQTPLPDPTSKEFHSAEDTKDSVYRLVTISYFDNCAKHKTSPFHASAILSHTNTPVSEDQIDSDAEADQNALQPNPSAPARPTILFAATWSEFPFSFKPVPIPTTPASLPQDGEKPTESLSYMMFELVGPFEFVLNPDQTTLDIPCTLNDIDLVFFQLTPSTLLFYFSDEIKRIQLSKDAMVLSCPKWLITTKFPGQQAFFPANPKFGLSVYYFITSDDNPETPADGWFVQTNARYAHSQIVDILTDRTITPYSTTLRIITEANFIYSRTSVMYQNYYKLPLPGPKNQTFELLKDHSISTKLVGAEFTNTVYTYFNPLDALSPPWALQDATPITPDKTVTIDHHIDTLFGKKHVEAFYHETFGAITTVPISHPLTHTIPDVNANDEYSHALSKVGRRINDPYVISGYSVIAPSVDSSAGQPFHTIQVPYAHFTSYDPSVSFFKIEKHPYWNEGLVLQLDTVQLDATFLEIASPRTEVLRFDGEFNCAFIQTGVPGDNKNNTKPVHLGSVTAVAGTFAKHSDSHHIDNATSLFFQFVKTPIERLKAGHSYKIQCAKSGKMVSYFKHEAGSPEAIKSDFLSLRIATIPTDTDPDTVPVLNYRQTSMIFEEERGIKVTVAAAVVIAMILVALAGGFFVYISGPKSPQVHTPVTPASSKSIQSSDGYQAPLLSSDDGVIAVDYYDSANAV